MRDTPGFVLFNAAVQPDTWYLEFATNAPGGESDPLMGNGFVVGKSFKDYWSVRANRETIGLCPLKTSENSALKGITGTLLNDIRVVQKLGLICLEGFCHLVFH